MIRSLLPFYLLVLSVQLASGQNSSGVFNEESSWEMCECRDGPCSCVVFYLCGRDRVIISSGFELVDERLGVVVKQCPRGQICCKVPQEDTPSAPVTPDKPLIPAESPASRPNEPGQSTAVCGLRGTAFNLEESWSRLGYEDTDTTFAEFPWMLALMRRERSDNIFVCGASLIHLRIALTAAHCVRRLKAEDIVVRAGEWNTTSDLEPVPHQDRRVSNIIIHPEFSKGALFNDIALLVIDRPFQDAINVGVICMPQLGATFNFERCIATGWGRDTFGKEGEAHTTLRKVELPVVESAFCQEKLRKTRLGIYFRLDKSFICAGGEPDRDTCEGDGGGPLICQSKVDPERYIQAGIVSWGLGCKVRELPAVYSNVAFLRSWIDGQLAQLGIESAIVQQ